MKALALFAALFTAACATDGHSTVEQGNEPKQHFWFDPQTPEKFDFLSTADQPAFL